MTSNRADHKEQTWANNLTLTTHTGSPLPCIQSWSWKTAKRVWVPRISERDLREGHRVVRKDRGKYRNKASVRIEGDQKRQERQKKMGKKIQVHYPSGWKVVKTPRLWEKWDAPLEKRLFWISLGITWLISVRELVCLFKKIVIILTCIGKVLLMQIRCHVAVLYGTGVKGRWPSKLRTLLTEVSGEQCVCVRMCVYDSAVSVRSGRVCLCVCVLN